MRSIRMSSSTVKLAINGYCRYSDSVQPRRTTVIPNAPRIIGNTATVDPVQDYHHCSATINTRLPPEIFCIIFINLTLQAPTEPHSPNRTLVWIPQVTHVCTYWREIALGYSNLWICPNFGCPSWVPPMIERSCNALLRVCAEVNHNHRRNQAVRFALSHLYRLKYLHLEFLPTSLQNIVNLIDINNPAPMLEALVLLNKGGAIKLLDSHMLPKSTPCLRVLQLLSIDISWSSHIYQGLTQLDINNTSKRGTPSMSQLLMVLRACPYLKRLSLRSCLPSHESRAKLNSLGPIKLSRVFLPNLEYFSIFGTVEEGAYLVNHVKLPPATTMDINCISYQNDTAVEELIVATAGQFTAFESPHEWTSLLALHVGNFISLTCHSADSASANFKLRIGSTTKPINIYIVACRLFPFSHVTYLETSFFQQEGPHALWLEYIDTAKIETLILQGPSFMGFRSIIQAANDSETDEVVTFSWPALRRIQMLSDEHGTEKQNIEGFIRACLAGRPRQSAGITLGWGERDQQYFSVD